MGRGRQSGHDRKEDRKQKRADAKDKKYEKSPRKVTKGALKKEVRAKKAVAESFKMASSINMDRKEENILLELIAMLDNVTIAPQQVQFNEKEKIRVYTPEEPECVTTSNVSEEDSSDSDVETDSEPDDEAASEQDGTGENVCAAEGDEEHSEVEKLDGGSEHEQESESSGSSLDNDDSSQDNDSSEAGESGSSDDESSVASSGLHEGQLAQQRGADDKVVIGRQKFIRQLIRDERRYVREQQQAQLLAPSAERVAARLKQSLQANATLNTTTAYKTTTIQGSASDNAPLRAVSTPVSGAGTSDIGFAYKPHKDKSANTAATRTVKPVLSSTVRVAAHFDKTGDGRTKPGPAKLMVLPRTTTVPELADILRVKFKATATVMNAAGAKQPKFDAVRVGSTGEIVHGFTLGTLPDGEVLVLFSLKNDTSYVEPSGATTAPADEPALGADTAAASVQDSAVSSSVDKAQVAGNAEGAASTAQAEAAGSTTDPPQPTKQPYWTPPMQDNNQKLNAATAAAPQDPTAVLRHNQHIRAQLTEAYKHPNYAPIREQRKSLPIFSVKPNILATIEHNPVVVVSGETGSGKTTQLPLYLLESMIKNDQADACNIICTQPRRIAAISVAERVHYECAQSGTYVHTSICICKCAILLRNICCTSRRIRWFLFVAIVLCQHV